MPHEPSPAGRAHLFYGLSYHASSAPPAPATRAPHAARSRLQGGGPQGTPRSRLRCRWPERAPKDGPPQDDLVRPSIGRSHAVSPTDAARQGYALALSASGKVLAGHREDEGAAGGAVGANGVVWQLAFQAEARAPQPWRWDGSGVRTGSPRVSRRGQRKRMRRCRAPPRWRSPGPRSACGDRRQPERRRARRGGRRHPPILVRGRPG